MRHGRAMRLDFDASLARSSSHETLTPQTLSDPVQRRERTAKIADQCCPLT